MDKDNSTDYDDSSEEKIITNRIACVVAHCMEMYYEKRTYTRNVVWLLNIMGKSRWEGFRWAQHTML